MLQIPSLLKLKHFPRVVFAGVDSPEDVLNDTYQELLRTGGFVVSDDKLLETLTLGESLIFLSLHSQISFSLPSDPNISSNRNYRLRITSVTIY